MYDGVIMSRTFSLTAVGLLAGTLTTISAARAFGEGVLRPETIRLAGDHYVAELADGGRAQLTLDPRMQASVDDVLRVFQIPYGAAVVVSVPDGRVLAMVGRSAA